jgi:hypothetical protein
MNTVYEGNSVSNNDIVNDSISLSSLSQQIIDTTTTGEQNNLKQDFSEISTSFFYGNWKDENSIISFFEDGKCLMKFSTYEVKYYWKYQDGYLYIGSDKNALTRHNVQFINSNSFSYIAENENISYHANRVD